MVSHFNTIVDVLERYYPTSDLVLASDCFSRGEDVLQDLDNSLTQPRAKAIEDKMWVRFTDGSSHTAGDIVSQDDIVKREGNSWPVRKVRDRHGSGRATMLV